MEVVAIIVILAVLIAVAIPLCRWFSADMRYRTNQGNLDAVRREGLTQVQTGLGNIDSTAPDGRHINEGMAPGAGWVALARVDGNKNIVSMDIFVVDDTAAYADGIAEGDVRTPVPAGASETFYPAPPRLDRQDPFSAVTPSSGYTAAGAKNTVYTVQVVLNNLEFDLVPV